MIPVRSLRQYCLVLDVYIGLYIFLSYKAVFGRHNLVFNILLSQKTMLDDVVA